MIMYLSAIVDKTLTIPDSLILSMIGFLVVFIALISLIAVIKALTALSSQIKPGRQGDSPHPSVQGGMVPASYSLGEIELYDVDDHSAALIMAIVADRLEAPLGTLRFKSIKQIDEVL